MGWRIRKEGGEEVIQMVMMAIEARRGGYVVKMECVGAGEKERKVNAGERIGVA